MLRVLSISVAFAVVLGSGLAHGLWTGRWQDSEEVKTAVAALDQVPLTIGDWHGRLVADDAESFAQAGAVGHWTRAYQGPGGTFTVILMCGPAARMAVHTPDVCYRGGGYEMVGEQGKTKVGQGPDEFWTAVFRKDQAAGTTYLRIFWAWKCEGEWQAPTLVRGALPRAPFLYKLYVVREVTNNENQEAVQALLEALCATLNRTLYSPGAGESEP